eukprot:scaffold1214_cov136-Isochrysis_galbana.AAC.14
MDAASAPALADSPPAPRSSNDIYPEGSSPERRVSPGHLVGAPTGAARLASHNDGRRGTARRGNRQYRGGGGRRKEMSLC